MRMLFPVPACFLGAVPNEAFFFVCVWQEHFPISREQFDMLCRPIASQICELLVLNFGYSWYFLAQAFESCTLHFMRLEFVAEVGITDCPPGWLMSEAVLRRILRENRTVMHAWCAVLTLCKYKCVFEERK